MKRIPWTSEDKKRLKKLYRNHTGGQCAKAMKRSIYTIYNRVYADKLKHSKKFQAKLKAFFRSNILKAGMPYRIKPGGKLPNAPGSEKGWFKKGGLPAGTLYDGALDYSSAKDSDRSL